MLLERPAETVVTHMTNDELSDAIIRTSAMLRSCPAVSDRYPMLLSHLGDLLKVEKERASQYFITGGRGDEQEG